MWEQSYNKEFKIAFVDISLRLVKYFMVQELLDV